MLDYINNLVRKASGSPLLLTPESLKDTGFEMFSQQFIPPDENSNLKSSRNFTIYPEDNGDSSLFVPGDRELKPRIKPKRDFTDSLTNPPVSESKKDKANYSQSGPASPKSKKSIGAIPEFHEDISGSATAEYINEFSEPEELTIKVKDSKEMIMPGMEGSLRESSSKYGKKKQNDITGSKSRPGDIKDDLPVKSSLKSEKENFDSVNSSSRSQNTSMEKNKSFSQQQAGVNVADIEPAAGVQQIFLEELINKTKTKTLPNHKGRKDVKTNQDSTGKEINVNIGRIELKSSQKTFPSAKNSQRGFEDHIMMRLYLDRHY